MNAPQCEVRTELGAYTLGLLDAAGERRVQEHIASCPACADEAASLQGTRSALELTDLEAIEHPPEPSPEVLPNLLARIRATRRRRRVAGAFTLAATLIVLAVGAFVAVDALRGSPDTDITVTPPSPTPSETPPEDAEPVLAVSGEQDGLSVSVEVWDREWGSALTVSLDGVPAGYECSLVAIGANGERETAASWVVPSGGYGAGGLTMDGSHALSPEDVESYEVVKSDGRVLATLPVEDA